MKASTASFSASASEFGGGHGKDSDAVLQVFDQDPLVGLMSEVQDSGAIGDAMRDVPDAIEVLLVVRPRARDDLRFLIQDSTNGALQRLGHR